MKITLEVPDQYLVDRDPAELAEHIKLYEALLMFRSREISAGAAVALSGVDRFTFAEECQRHGIPLAAAALQFSLRDSRIASTVVGMSSPDRVAETLTLASLEVPDTLWDELAALAPPQHTWL